MHRQKKNFFFTLLYTLIFTALIFTGKEIFFPSELSYESYIEPALGEDFLAFDYTREDSNTLTPEEKGLRNQRIYESYVQKYEESKKQRVFFRYVPSSLLESIEYSYLPIVEVLLYSDYVLPNISKMGVYLYQNRADTRGRMRGGNLHMYGIERFTDSEFLSVLVHEFAHYHDVYTLKGNAFGDVSQKFYDISWSSVTTLQENSQKDDFVSGYAMTNWYEDFAESYTYYMLHNEDFAYKAQSSRALREKYIFLQTYVFSKNSFTQTDFSTEDIREYYWDITKIPVDVKNFLQSIQDGI